MKFWLKIMRNIFIEMSRKIFTEISSRTFKQKFRKYRKNREEIL